jgi:hypothetical protein
LTVSCGESGPSGPEIGGGAYYVSPSGDDGNPGTIHEPWLTVGKAAETLVAGDTVYIREGTYYEHVEPLNSGTEEHPIIYTTYPGETATLDGTGVTIPGEWGGLLQLYQVSHIEIVELVVGNVGTEDNHCGILIDGCSDIEVRDCYTCDTRSSGIGVWDSSVILIDGNEVELACNDGEQECITIAGTSVFQVSNNLVHMGGPGGIGGEGIDVKDGSSVGSVYGNEVCYLNRLGIYVDAWDKDTGNISVYGNVVHHCADDGYALAAEAGGLLHDVSVYNNIAYDNDNSGLTVAGWGEPVPSHPMSQILIINNTFYSNGTEGWGVGISVENPDADYVTIRNNILSQNLYSQILVEEVGVGLAVDHNLFDGTGDPYGTEYQEGWPGFVDPGDGDFDINSGSPAIDNGSADEAPDDDFEGNARPSGSGFDIGAYEYVFAL